MLQIPVQDYKSLFEKAPGLYLVLLPDFTIAGVSDAYLTATMTVREDIIGRGLFDVFPDNPADKNSDGTSNLRNSLKKVIAQKTPHAMPVQRYDIRRPDGVFETRYWDPLNTPVLGANNEVLYIIHNVTEVTFRQATQEKLKEYQHFFNNSNDFFCIANRDGYFEMVNPSFENVLGYTSKELYHNAFIQFVHPDDVADTVEAYNKLKSGETLLHFINRYRKKDGSYLWFDWNATAHAESGKLYCIARDFTGRKTAEDAWKKLNEELEQRVQERTAALEKNETHFRTLIENSDDIIALLDNNLLHVYRSPSSERITGFSWEERIKSGKMGDVHPEDSLEFEESLEAVRANPGKAIPVTYRVKHKLGHYIWLEGTFTNLLQDPAIGAIVVNMRDVTERKELETLLHNANVLARIGGWEIDLVKGTVYWSDITREIHETAPGYVPTLETGLNFYKEGKSRDLIMKKVKEAIETGAAWDAELQIITAQNNERWIRTIGKTAFADDKCVRIYGSFQDIHQRKMAEEKINTLNAELEEKIALRTAQLKKTNEELEAFSYSVSHDLRAPLRAIIGFAAILEEEYSSKLDDEARRITSVIKNNTRKMGNLIDDLLNFSRMGRHELTKTNVDTAQIVNEIRTGFDKKEPAAKEVRWIIHALPEVKADVSTIRQVWINLISNAIKYSAKAPAPAVEIGSLQQEGSSVFFIKDNGVGFDGKYKNKLFKVFQRLHSHDDFEGTGIGLAIVEKIISKHGGSVWAEAAPGEGATFYFSLPND